MFLTTEIKLPRDLSCPSHEMEQVQAALWGPDKMLAHENPRNAGFAGVNLQICPIKLHLGSVL